MNTMNLKGIAKQTVISLAIFSICSQVYAGEDVKVLLEILLEKGVITQEEFDKKLKKASEAEEVKV